MTPWWQRSMTWLPAEGTGKLPRASGKGFLQQAFQEWGGGEGIDQQKRAVDTCRAALGDTCL